MININDIEDKNKIKKIIRFKNPLKLYFNKWKYFIDLEETEINENGIKKKIFTKKKLIIKKDKNIENDEDEEIKNIILKRKPNEKIEKKERNKLNEEKFIKLMKKRVYDYNKYRDILKKYYNIWISKISFDVNESIIKKVAKKKIISLKKEKKEYDDDNNEKEINKDNKLELNKPESEIIKKELNDNNKENIILLN